MLLRLELEKQRRLGVVYTPSEVALELTKFVLAKLGTSTQTILEPSVGDGAFLRAIEEVRTSNVKIHGVDIDPAAILSLGNEFPHAEFQCGDFINYAVNYDGPGFDLIIGNPPYIRWRNLDSSLRESVTHLSEITGYPLSELKNAWAAFVVASNLLLRDGGVLAFIVPYELLNVKYGQRLQAFLAETFEKVEIFIPNDKAFRQLDQDAVALVATKSSAGVCVGVELSLVKSLSELIPIKTREVHFDEKHVSNVDLNSVFFDGETAELLHKLRNGLKSILDYASSSAGVVSAANSFFILTATELDERELRSWARPILQKGAYLPAGPIFSKEHLIEILDEESAFLLDFVQENTPPLSPAALRYIAEGQALGLDRRYKSRHRTPWYNIPIVNPSDGIFFKRSHSFPRLCANEARVLVTDTAYQVRMLDGFSIRDLCYSFYNSLTLLFCEMDGRFYGGGVLELTPTEFRGVPVHFQVPREQEFQEFLQNFPKSKTPELANFEFADMRLAQQLGLSDVEILRIREALTTVRSHRLRHAS